MRLDRGAYDQLIKLRFMRSLSLFVALTVVRCGQTSQEQAREAIGTYLQSTLHEPDSYKPLATMFRPYRRTDSVMDAQVLLRRQLTVLETRRAEAVGDSARTRAASERVQRQFFYLAHLRDTTRVGWRVTQVYQAKNSFGVLIKSRGKFIAYPGQQVLVVAYSE